MTTVRKLPSRPYLVEMYRDEHGRDRVRAHRGTLATARGKLSTTLIGAWVVKNATNMNEAVAHVSATVNRNAVEVHKVI